MKNICLLLLLLITSLGWSQDLTDRIKKVESGLIFPSTTPINQKLPLHNIANQLEKYKIHGASVAVIKNGQIDWSKGYGHTDYNQTKPISDQTLFQSASIGKIITSLMVLKLAQDGKLDLDENINNKLKRWKLTENEFTEKQHVTIRHLLSHSSGLTDDYGFLGYKTESEIPSLLQILNNRSPSKAKKPLLIKTIPGTVERYSGGGFLILQLLIEDVSGLSFEDFAQKNIFDPLNMSHSTYNQQPDKNLKLPIASGHRSNGKPLKKKHYHIYPEMAAAGPWTTAIDLANLVIGIQKNLIINAELTQEMMTPQINQKGLGVNLKGLDKPEMFWHAGQNLGYTGLVYGSLNDGYGAVILLNSDGGELLMQEFMSSVAITYNWPVMKSYRSLSISKNEIERICGSYKDINNSKGLIITYTKQKLIVSPINSKESVELIKIDENHYTFKNTQDYYKLVFVYESEKITKLLYTKSIGNTRILNKLKNL